MLRRVLGLAAVLGFVAAVGAEAAPIDWSGAVTAVTAEVTGAITSALPVLGTILGLYVGYRIFKHFTGSK